MASARARPEKSTPLFRLDPPVVALALLVCGISGAPQTASADTTPTEIPTIDLNTLLPGSAVKAILKTLGIWGGHRPYDGATTSASSISLGVEATLVHLPDDFASSLSSTGMGSGSTSTAMALPIAKIHLNKGLGPRTGIGLSGLYFKGNYMLGGDFKVVLAEPEEGPTWAMRLSYSRTKVDFGSIGIPSLPITVSGVNLGSSSLILKSETLSPQVLASRKLDFAEPYIGLGLDWTTGSIDVPIKLNVLETTQTLSTASYSAVGGSAFLGVSFLAPLVGFKLDIEGSYSTLGMHSIGLVVGLGF